MTDSSGAVAGFDTIKIISDTARVGLMKTTLDSTLPCSDKYKVRLISTSPADTSAASRPFEIFNPPFANIRQQGGDTACIGQTITMEADSVASANYRWQRNGAFIPGANMRTYHATASGEYRVKVSGGECYSISAIRKLFFNNSLPPTPTITQNGNQLVSSSTSGNQWYLNNQFIQGAAAQYFTPLVPGNYTVQVSLNGCSSAFSPVFNFIITSVQDIGAFDGYIKLFPNPVKHKLTIIRSGTISVLNIRLIDMNGKQLKNVTSTSSRIEIDMTPYASGLYIIWIKDKISNTLGRKVIARL